MSASDTSPPVGGKQQKMCSPSPWQDTTVICWGSHDHGQLGLGGIEDEHIELARDLVVFQKRRVQSIGCGEFHTMFVMQDGTVYSCGNNDCGQLGHDVMTRIPRQIDAIETQVVRVVACGSNHTVALTENGLVFTWGSNLYGQLGRGYTDETSIAKPKLVREIQPIRIVQIVCGNNHNICMSEDGKLFSWGQNEHGQLGLGLFSAKVDTPKQITSLQGLPVQQIAAGGYHSFFLSKSGALFGCGKNLSGQLGVGDEVNKCYPAQCKTLRSQHIKYISCGEDHSVALTKDGGVFTFGSGAYGQLGHNAKQNELLPRKVFELMGCVVSQVTCGRKHTLAFTPSTGRLHTFGLGGSGQLGVGQFQNRLNPSIVKGPLVPYNKSDFRVPCTPLSASVTIPTCIVKRVYSGGDQSFALVSTARNQEKPSDFRRGLPSSQQILEFTLNETRELTSIPSMANPPHNCLQNIENLLSSACCMNKSFLVDNDGHYDCNSRNHGINLEIASEILNSVSSLPNKKLKNQFEGLFEKHIVDMLPTKPPDVESLRVYLSLPCCYLFNNPASFSTILCPYANAMLSLGPNPIKVIGRWWSSYSPQDLDRLIKIYKEAIVYIISLGMPLHTAELAVRQKSVFDLMGVLKKLNEVNESSGQIVPYDHFYIPDLVEKIDIKADYRNWVQHQSNRSNSNGRMLFCNYPFVFDATAKTLLLQEDAFIQMRSAVDEVQRRNLIGLFMPQINQLNPLLVLLVTRDNIVQDTINQLAKQGACDYKKPLKVVFLGEEAVDDGGVKKEFFMLLLREILDLKYGMFQYYEESRLLWFSQQSFEESMMYKLIGLLCGLAIYNGTIIDLQFPLALYKKLLNRPITLDDLTELKPTVGKSLSDMLIYDGDDFQDVFCLSFETTQELYGEVKTVELKPNGSNLPVDKANRQEYVDLLVDYTFNKSVQEQFQAFFEGFHKVTGGSVLSLFHPQELMAMVVGNENYDWQKLEELCQYKGAYCPKHQTIQIFWEVFHEMTHDQKKTFLKFLTGCDRIPIHGMRAIQMTIQPTGGGEDFLPVAHTCFNLLDLPRYIKKDIMKKKLLTAIEQSEGFGLV